MNQEWVSRHIERLASFSEGQRGVSRLAFTKTDVAARAYITELLQESGLEVRQDAIGNIIARLPGVDTSAPAVVTGSHLDSVPEGGRYDGVVGVIGGLAAILALKERGPLAHSLELIIFAAEESSRFGIATMGSKAMAGQVNTAVWSRLEDKNHILLPEAVKAAGGDFTALAQVVRNPEEMKCFLELHIEQGCVLEKADVPIGVVEGIASPTRFKVIVEGVAAHSGATPMQLRQDALVSASMIVLAIQEIALEQADKGTVATVGNLKVHPGAMNVIPGMVEMWVDIRGIEHESIIECLQEIKDAISSITDTQDTVASIEMLSSEKPVMMDSELMECIEEMAGVLELETMRMPSGAGHDAMNMARLVPTGMIFIPSKDGISHNPDEHTDMEAIMAGIAVLTETLYQQAK